MTVSPDFISIPKLNSRNLRSKSVQIFNNSTKINNSRFQMVAGALVIQIARLVYNKKAPYYLTQPLKVISTGNSNHLHRKANLTVVWTVKWNILWTLIPQRWPSCKRDIIWLEKYRRDLWCNAIMAALPRGLGLIRLCKEAQIMAPESTTGQGYEKV